MTLTWITLTMHCSSVKEQSVTAEWVGAARCMSHGTVCVINDAGEEMCPHHVLTGGVLGSRQDSRLLHTPAAICYGVMIHDGVMYAHYLTVGYTWRCVVVYNCNGPRGGKKTNSRYLCRAKRWCQTLTYSTVTRI